MAYRVTIDQASEILGMSKQSVRCGLQYGTLPIGVAMKNGSKYIYHISPKLLMDYTGCTSEDIKRCKERK